MQRTRHQRRNANRRKALALQLADALHKVASARRLAQAPVITANCHDGQRLPVASSVERASSHGMSTLGRTVEYGIRNGRPMGQMRLPRGAEHIHVWTDAVRVADGLFQRTSNDAPVDTSGYAVIVPEHITIRVFPARKRGKATRV